VAELVTLRFPEVGSVDYEAVNRQLGLDPSTGEGDWPDGLLAHAAGVADDGSFVVTEIWSSREAQASFVAGRLGAALGAAGVAVAPTVTWVSLVAVHTPRRE